MKYCPYCGTPLSNDMRFCPECGKPCGEIQNMGIPVAPPQKKRNKIWLILLIIVGVIVVVSWYSNISFDPTANYETDYNEGVSYYNRGNYSSASDCFQKVGDEYKSTYLYKILCEGHIHHELSDEQVNELKQHLDFADTKSVLLSDSHIAETFLLGYWTTENKSKRLEFYLQSDYCGVSTNLANSSKWDKADSFYIIDGVFGLYLPKDGVSHDDEKALDLLDIDSEYDREDLFRISILSKDKIAVVVLDDDSRYVLERE